MVLEVYSDCVYLSFMGHDPPLFLSVESVFGQLTLGGADKETIKKLSSRTYFLLRTAHDQHIFGPAIAESDLAGISAGDDP